MVNAKRTDLILNSVSLEALLERTVCDLLSILY